MMLRLYLCGSVAGRSAKEMREEREAAAAAIRERGWTPVDPLVGEYEMLKRRQNIQDDQSGLTPANITLKDKYALEQCDILLWLTADVASYGSCIEIGLAWALGKPVICIDAAKRGRGSAFVAHIAMYIGDTLDEAMEFIATYLLMPTAEDK